MLKIAWRPEYHQPLPEGHRFPMEKYSLLPEQLLYEGTVQPENFFSPVEINNDILSLTHCEKYISRLKNLELSMSEQRKTGFPLTASLVSRELYIMEGTRKCAEYALECGIAMNIAGGTHHAYFNKGEGFCLLNDNAVGANFLLSKKLAQKILIVDLDVHQGNGTAALFQNENRVFTFSMHGEKNYPMHKEKSDCDIELPDGTSDKKYLEALRVNLNGILEAQNPDFIFYQCGVDVLGTDKLGRLNLSMEGCKMRDKIVLSACKQNNIPVVCSMGGGYSADVRQIIEAHANTYRLAQEIFF